MFGIKIHYLKKEIQNLQSQLRNQSICVEDLEKRIKEGFNVIQEDQRKLQYEFRHPFLYDLGEEIFFGVNKGMIVVERSVGHNYLCGNDWGIKLNNYYILFDRKDGSKIEKSEDEILKEANTMDATK